MSSRLHLVQPAERKPRERRDKRGRRIGHNWWREYNCEMLLDATLVWERQCEDMCMGYPTEIGEYAEAHPRPTLKAFLIGNKGMADRETVERCA